MKTQFLHLSTPQNNIFVSKYKDLRIFSIEKFLKNFFVTITETRDFQGKISRNFITKLSNSNTIYKPAKFCIKFKVSSAFKIVEMEIFNSIITTTIWINGKIVKITKEIPTKA